MGLVSDHSYAVIKAVDLQTKQYGRLRLLQLRNPWGHKEWLGDWSDKSDKWTDDLKKQVGFVDADDGMFFISFNDYMNYYRSTTICKVNDNFNHNSIKVTQNNGNQPYQLIKINL